MISVLTEGSAYDHIVACCSLRDIDQACGLFIQNLEGISWKYFLLVVGRNISQCYWQALHSWPSVSSDLNLPVVFTVSPVCVSCKIAIDPFISWLKWWNSLQISTLGVNGYIKLIGSVVDSRQSTTPWRSNECHYVLILFKRLVIRVAQWGSPDQWCCPCTDKWLPLLKRPFLLIWISGFCKTLCSKSIPSLMLAKTSKEDSCCLLPQSVWT